MALAGVTYTWGREGQQRVRRIPRRPTRTQRVSPVQRADLALRRQRQAPALRLWRRRRAKSAGPTARCRPTTSACACAATAITRFRFPKPPGYDPAKYELLRRYLDADAEPARQQADGLLRRAQPQDRHATTTGPFSTDDIGGELGVSRGDAATPPRDLGGTQALQQGFLYFLANDPSVPQDHSRRDQQVGPGQGRVRGQRSLAHAALHPRVAAAWSAST